MLKMTEEIKIPYKQFVILPKKPKMSKGKLCSQTAHATFMALEKQECKKLINDWKEKGMCVIVLECDNEQQLNNLSKYLEQWKIPHHMYVDEGLYGCKPFTATALATGVLTEDQFWMFKSLKVFK